MYHLRGELKIDVHLNQRVWSQWDLPGEHWNLGVGESLSVNQSIDKKNDQQAPLSAAWNFQIVPKGKHPPWKNVSTTSISRCQPIPWHWLRTPAQWPDRCRDHLSELRRLWQLPVELLILKDWYSHVSQHFKTSPPKPAVSYWDYSFQ